MQLHLIPPRLCEICQSPILSKQATRFCSHHCRNVNNSRSRPRLKGQTCRVCGSYGYGRKGDLCWTCIRNDPDAVRRIWGRRSGRRPARGAWADTWSEDERQYLCDHYPIDGSVTVAAALNRTPGQVLSKAFRLGLRLTKDATSRIVNARARAYMLSNNPMRTEGGVNAVRAWRAANPDRVREIDARLQAGHARLERTKPSGLEFRLRRILDGLGVTYEPSAIIKPKFVVDIRIGSLIIEADGDYWHGHPRFEPLSERQKAQQSRDRARDAYLVRCGYTVVRIWERDMSEEAVKSALHTHSAASSSPDPSSLDASSAS